VQSFWQRQVWLTAACAIAWVMGSAPARATPIFSITPATVGAGGSGEFEVILTNSGSPIGVAGFNFEITTSNTAITFTDITDNTVIDPYIYLGDSLLASGTGSILETPPSTAQDAQAGDYPLTGIGNTLGPGSAYSLGLVLFSVAPGAAAGPVTINFGGATSLSDPNGNSIAFGSTPGQVIITAPVIQTPEPRIFGMVGLGFLSLITIRKRLS